MTSQPKAALDAHLYRPTASSASRALGVIFHIFVLLAIVNALADEPLPPAIVVERDIMVPMRDGVKLATYVRRPEVTQKVPAILIRTPYGAKPRGNIQRELARPGDPATRYAIVTQDTRGRYASEGEFYPFINESNDGYDAVEWVAKQPWCDGNVAMSGGSYVGYTQLAAAMAQPPHLRAISAVVPPSDLNRTMFESGALRMELGQGWMIGLAFSSQRVLEKKASDEEKWRESGAFSEWCWHLPLSDPGAIALGGPSYEKAWRDFIGTWNTTNSWGSISPIANVEKIKVPVLIIGGWYDIFSQSNIDLWAALRAHGGSELTRTQTRLLMGPWVHGIEKPAGAVNFAKALHMRPELERRWFDHWLRNNSDTLADIPPLRYFQMNNDAWVDSNVWPPKDSQPKKFYLSYDPVSRKHSLSAKAPTEDVPPSQFQYDPRRPVPTLGGNNLNIAHGIQDHWENTQRHDVIGFETEPLAKDVTVAGRVHVHLVAASSTPDTDFTAMLLDVVPGASDERARHGNVLDSVVRVRFRNGRDKDQPLTSDVPVELDFDLGSTAYIFKKGHSIRLNVSSSNFPRFDRNLNTADPAAQGTSIRAADNKIFHDSKHVSAIELPVLQ